MLIRVLKHMVDAFHSRRDLVVGLLKEIPGVKSTFQRELTYSQTFLSSKTLKGTEIKNAMDFQCTLPKLT
jgi:aspartate aminotransferase